MSLIDALRKIPGIRDINNKLTQTPILKAIYRPVRERFLPKHSRAGWSVHDWVADNLTFSRQHKLVEFSFAPDGAYIKASDGIQYWYDLRHSQGHLHGAIHGDPIVGAELGVILRNILPGSVFFDIGVGVGEYAMNVAAKVPGSFVPCFEPTQELWQCVQKSIQRNGLSDRIKCYQVAVSDTVGEFAIAPISEGCFVLRGEDVDLSGYSTQDIVKTTTIDTYVAESELTHVDFIKADVEGAEIYLLKGAEICLRTHKPHLQLELVEYCAHRLGYKVSDIFDYLDGLGYTCVAMVNHEGDVLQPRAGETVASMLDRAFNFFFCHNSKSFAP